jgi:2-methylcitrate dehydratase PrpD
MVCYRFDLTEAQTKNAFSILEYYNLRSDVIHSMTYPSMVKDGSAWGCFIGTFAGLLVMSGFTSCPSKMMLDFNFNFDSDFEFMLLKYHIFKKFPTCYWAQASIQAALNIRKHIVNDINDIKSIIIETFPEALTLFKGVPNNTEEAQYSIVYPVVSALMDGFIDNISVSKLNNTNTIKRDLINKPTVRLHKRFKDCKINESKYHYNCS